MASGCVHEGNKSMRLTKQVASTLLNKIHFDNVVDHYNLS